MISGMNMVPPRACCSGIMATTQVSCCEAPLARLDLEKDLWFVNV